MILVIKQGGLKVKSTQRQYAEKCIAQEDWKKYIILWQLVDSLSVTSTEVYSKGSITLIFPRCKTFYMIKLILNYSLSIVVFAADDVCDDSSSIYQLDNCNGRYLFPQLLCQSHTNSHNSSCRTTKPNSYNIVINLDQLKNSTTSASKVWPNFSKNLKS